jgi:hypothetical protein
VHHLAREGYPFEAIAAAVDAFTTTTAAVEFIPGHDRHLQDWAVAKEAWYTQGAFIEKMARYFPKVEVLPSSPDPRTLLIFRRA